MKWTALVVVCVVLLSSALVAQSLRIDTPVAEDVTSEAATLSANIRQSTTPAGIRVYFGTRHNEHEVRISMR